MIVSSFPTQVIFLLPYVILCTSYWDYEKPIALSKSLPVASIDSCIHIEINSWKSRCVLVECILQRSSDTYDHVLISYEVRTAIKG